MLHLFFNRRNKFLKNFVCKVFINEKVIGVPNGTPQIQKNLILTLIECIFSSCVPSSHETKSWVRRWRKSMVSKKYYKHKCCTMYLSNILLSNYVQFISTNNTYLPISMLTVKYKSKIFNK